MNWLDRIALELSPRWAAGRLRNRNLVERLYDVANTSARHTARTGSHSGDGVMQHARDKLRKNARYLDENHDLVVGILGDLVMQSTHIRIEPMVRDDSGQLAESVNEQLANKFENWKDQAESTGALGWTDACFLLGLSWFRDGEVFEHRILAGDYPYPTDVPLTIELLEADFLPFDKTEQQPVPIIHGVEKDRFGRATAYHFATSHPGDSSIPGNVIGISPETVRVDAARVSHLKIARRLGQTRGASVLAPVLRRLEDVKDYEESERIAARVAADLCAIILRGADFGATTINATTLERPQQMQAGMIFEGGPGDDVRVLGNQRPNPQLAAYRKDQLRAVAAGTGSSYSSTARDYDGSYSSQRQELVENQFRFRRPRESFIAQRMRPLWRDFVQACMISGVIDIAGADVSSLFEAEMTGGVIPWIDKRNEVTADDLAVKAGFASRWQVIRERGGDPRKVDRERERDPFTPARTDDQVEDLQVVDDHGKQASKLRAVND